MENRLKSKYRYTWTNLFCDLRKHLATRQTSSPWGMSKTEW